MIINDFIMIINNVHYEKIVLKQSRIFLSSIYDSYVSHIFQTK